MGLANAYVLAVNRIPDLYQKIRDGQAPDRFTNQLLKDWGFRSTNDRAFIPLLKAMGFLTSDGIPTPRYNEYRDHSKSKTVMGQALREAYADVFLIKEHPTPADKGAVEGKFKSFHNVSDHVANLMAKTFMAQLALADLSHKVVSAEPQKSDKPSEVVESLGAHATKKGAPSLHYNIQIHLPATKDLEVYNAIFKSIREHLFND